MEGKVMEKKKVNLKKFTGSKLFTLIVLFVVIFVVLTVLSKGALVKPRNIRNILQSITVVTMLTIGSGVMLIGGEVDLSLGGIGTLGAMVAAAMLAAGMPWIIAFIVAILVCALCGAVNAFMVKNMGFPTFIATLAMASIAKGIAYIISRGKQIDINNSVFAFIGTERFAKYIPYSIVFPIAGLIIYGIILSKTKYGRSIYLVGGNPEAARLCGLNPKKIYYSLFINAACLAGLAGTLLAARLKCATVDGITAQQFTGITGAILGGISFGGGTGGMGGALVGILILNTFNNGMQVLGVPTYWQTVASGLLLLVALIFDYFTSRRKS